MYGSGVYLAGSCTKADEYAKDEPGDYYDGINAMLLCRTCMGKMYYTTKRDENAGDNALVKKTPDCTLGDRSASAGTFREFVVHDTSQVYPEYIVFYRGLYGDQLPGEA
eukprot:TRINITY_DN101699_c0_g1_i1.p2 TRINITY_DN101699_c0_g1~~TRINITY_DN101699_c0_g1_i1.p2  ORF type:complete len:109 (-),score=17.58 TRINITY_DN101699_c0_g1_i1:45-371(-)